MTLPFAEIEDLHSESVRVCLTCWMLCLASGVEAHAEWHTRVDPAFRHESFVDVLNQTISKLEMRRVTSDWPRTSQQAAGYKQGMYDAIATLKQVRDIVAGEES